MKREKELVKNTLILAMGNFLPKLTTFITLPIMTLYLTKSEYGSVDLLSTLVILLLPAISLQIYSAAFRFLIYVREKKQECVSVITNIFAFLIPVLCCFLVVAYILLSLWKTKLRVLILLYFISDFMLNAIRMIARGLGKNQWYSLSCVISSLCYMVGIGICLSKLNIGFSGVLVSYIFSGFVGIMLLSWKIQLFSYIDFSYISIAEIKKMLQYSWPLVPNNLANWVLDLSDRVVITAFLGTEANAMYAVANKFPGLTKTFQSTFSQAWQENASLSVNEEGAGKYYSDMFSGVYGIMTGVVAGLIAVTPICFRLMIRGSYDDAYNQIPLLYLGMFFSTMSSVLGGIYIAHMKTRHVGITTCLAAVSNLVLDLLLVKRMGIMAGSMSTLFSFLLLTIYRMYHIKSFEHMRYHYGYMILSILSLIFMGIMFIQKNLCGDIFNLCFAAFIAAMFNKNLLKQIYNKRKFAR